MTMHPVDIHVGRRLRLRRKLLGLTQEKLAEAVDIRFQQIQKYESGANRISASRLWSLSRAMKVSVAFFFEGMNGAYLTGEHAEKQANGFADAPDEDVLEQTETIDLVRYYYQLNEGPRRRLLDLAKALSNPTG